MRFISQHLLSRLNCFGIVTEVVVLKHCKVQQVIDVVLLRLLSVELISKFKLDSSIQSIGGFIVLLRLLIALS